MASFQPPDNNEADSLVNRLNNVLQREIQRMNSTVKQLEEIETISVLPLDRNEHSRIIREHEQCRLVAQLKTMQKTPLVSLPTDEQLILKISEEHFTNEIHDSKELVKNLELEEQAELRKSKSLDDELEEENRILAMVREHCREEGISYDLGQTGSAAVRDTHSVAVQSPESMAEELENKIRKLNDLNLKRQKQWQEFLVKNFPQTDDYDDELSDDDLFQFEGRGPMRSLVAIVQDLVSSYLDKTGNNYIEVESNMWEPHIEFLIRCGVAVRNPNNPSHIRLEKFAD